MLHTYSSRTPLLGAGDGWMACIKSWAYAVMITVANKCTVTCESQNFPTAAASCLRNYLATHRHYCLQEGAPLPQTSHSLLIHHLRRCSWCVGASSLFDDAYFVFAYEPWMRILFGTDNIFHLNLNFMLLNIALISKYILLLSSFFVWVG